MWAFLFYLDFFTLFFHFVEFLDILTSLIFFDKLATSIILIA